jgi:hypothetical protein
MLTLSGDTTHLGAIAMMTVEHILNSHNVLPFPTFPWDLEIFPYSSSSEVNSHLSLCTRHVYPSSEQRRPQSFQTI